MIKWDHRTARGDAAKTYGYLIYKCTITGKANNVTQLGRPWGPARRMATLDIGPPTRSNTNTA